jgi:hypothetical protein
MKQDRCAARRPHAAAPPLASRSAVHKTTPTQPSADGDVPSNRRGGRRPTTCRAVCGADSASALQCIGTYAHGRLAEPHCVSVLSWDYAPVSGACRRSGSMLPSGPNPRLRPRESSRGCGRVSCTAAMLRICKSHPRPQSRSVPARWAWVGCADGRAQLNSRGVPPAGVRAGVGVSRLPLPVRRQARSCSTAQRRRSSLALASRGRSRTRLWRRLVGPLNQTLRPSLFPPSAATRRKVGGTTWGLVPSRPLPSHPSPWVLWVFSGWKWPTMELTN